MKTFINLMGVAHFSSFLTRYPTCLRCPSALRSTSFKHVLLDGNGFLFSNTKHASVEQTFNKGLHTFMKIWSQINHRIKVETDIFIALDGKAPLAKAFTQRKRRQIKSIPITLGCSLSEKMNEKIQQIIAKEAKHQTLLSGINCNGEGEQKIFEYLSSISKTLPTKQRKVNNRCLVIGQDSDLILYSLLAPTNLALSVWRDKNISIDIPALKEAIILEVYKEPAAILDLSQTKKDQVLSDFVFVMLLSGNDFLPSLQGGVEIWDSYVNLRATLFPNEALWSSSVIGNTISASINEKFFALLFSKHAKPVEENLPRRPLAQKHDYYSRICGHQFSWETQQNEDGEKTIRFSGMGLEHAWDETISEHESIKHAKRNIISNSLPTLRALYKEKMETENGTYVSFDDWADELERHTKLAINSDMKRDQEEAFLNMIAWNMEYMKANVPMADLIYDYSRKPGIDRLCKRLERSNKIETSLVEGVELDKVVHFLLVNKKDQYHLLPEEYHSFLEGNKQELQKILSQPFHPAFRTIVKQLHELVSPFAQKLDTIPISSSPILYKKKRRDWAEKAKEENSFKRFMASYRPPRRSKPNHRPLPKE